MTEDEAMDRIVEQDLINNDFEFWVRTPLPEED